MVTKAKYFLILGYFDLYRNSLMNYLLQNQFAFFRKFRSSNRVLRIIERFLVNSLFSIAAMSVAVAESAPNQKTTQQIGELTVQIEQAIEENDRLKKLVEKSKSEMRRLYEWRLQEVQTNGVADINTLAELIVREEQKGIDLGPARQQVVEWLERLSPALIRHIDERMDIVTEMVSREGTVEPQDEMKLKMQIDEILSKIIFLHDILFRSALNMEALSIDVTTVRDYQRTALQELAVLLVVAIELNSENVKNLRFRLSLATKDADLKTEIRVAEYVRSYLARHLGATANLLTQFGIDTSEYKSRVVQITGDLSVDVFHTSVLSALLKKWSANIWNWIAENGLNILFKFIVFVLILFTARVLSKVTKRGLERAVSRMNLSRLLERMIVGICANVVFLLGVLIALSQLGVSLGPLLAGLGVVGFIIGFALQDTLGNFASGLMILLYRPYDIGDVIDAGGVYGKVDRMSLVNTVILTFDNQNMVVPNSKIWGDVIRNVTAQEQRRVDLTFSISYKDDVAKAERVLADIVASDERILETPAPVIKLNSLGESSVDFVVRPWVCTKDYWDVYWEVTREVKMRFDAEGINIPYPQRTVHIVGTQPKNEK